jgi:hypothetical protein
MVQHRFVLDRWLFLKAYVVAFRIPHNIFQGKVCVEFLYELSSFLQFFEGYYEKKIAITEFRKHTIHST